jgi:hypothetical protein
MNNASIIIEPEADEVKAPLYRERAEQLTEIIEALQHIAGSSYWKVLKQFVFDVDLDKAISRLAKEKDTTEMFRLQGEIRWGEKYNLEKLLTKYRNELEVIRKHI